MRKFLLGLMLSACLLSCNSEKKEEATGSADSATATPEKKPAAELLDASVAESVKQSFEAFARGDIDAMIAGFDENLRYSWSNGDSLIGKNAVAAYYRARWKLIDSFSFSEPIVLPVQINEAQSKYAPPGKWVLYWAMADVKYKNGKKLNFWLHSVNHFNDAGKVDFSSQYMDRHPIIEATKGMK